MVNKFSKYISLFIIHCVLLIAFIKCTTENKLAKEFIKTRRSIDVIVLKPEFLIKTNLKEDSIQQLTTLTQAQKDSIGIIKSIFLKNVNDSALINNYYQAIVDELKEFGFNVITDTLLFSSVDSQQSTIIKDSVYYKLNISQIELDENYIPYEDQIQEDTTMYVQSFDLNEVALDTWIEASEERKTLKKSVVLYSEHTASDLISGGFERNLFGEVLHYKYKIDKITDDDINKLVSFSAKKNASYYFDYLMNKHVGAELKKSYNLPSTVYFHYNRFYNYLTPVYNNDRFTIMK